MAKTVNVAILLDQAISDVLHWAAEKPTLQACKAGLRVDTTCVV